MNGVFKVLADSTRRQILRMLKEGDLPAGEIAAAFTIARPSISYHLGLLEDSGLLTSDRRGQQIFYSLNMTVVQDVLQWFMELTRVDAGGENHER